MKISLARKKASRIPTDTLVEVYVSRVNLDEATLEVCLTREEALERASSGRSKIPASSLTVGEILTGTVTNVTPYGVFVDVNANRNGLLHISKVAAKQNAFVAQEDGLKKLGLVKGSPVFVMVVSNDGKRLEFDLAPDIADSDDDDDEDDDDEDIDDDKDDDDEDDNPFRGMTSFKLSSTSGAEKSIRELDVSSNVVDDEAAMWAAYAAANTSTNNDEEEEEDDDEYDEDADIEDALGIGSW
jgi:transcriptional accessory protein Tex/SPT6